MSLVGIDIGSSSVKATAFTEEGSVIATSDHKLTPLYPKPGHWETDPEDIWHATTMAMQKLTSHTALKQDPPKAIAISASGRENFPADINGNPLGNGIMGADVRGQEVRDPAT
ncbi:MAG: FGGY family carbohydrate kinase [Chloroflexota bacterium]